MAIGQASICLGQITMFPLTGGIMIYDILKAITHSLSLSTAVRRVILCFRCFVVHVPILRLLLHWMLFEIMINGFSD